MSFDAPELVHEFASDCPYCGEGITLLADLSPGDHNYIEDCEICCRPIQVFVSISATGAPQISLFQENDTP